ncbi:MAG: LysR family transcriptional regulator [Peptococcaceae bacterium]|nr:LysR family transcriptional regulator [Peptococcaceae bacterium]
MLFLNTKNLIYALTVAEERSFSNAAKKLYLSQPSLSQSISALEKELGAPIFDRSTIPLSLTYAGEKFIKAASEILSIERRLKREIEDILDSKSGRLVIGISSLRCTNIIPLAFPIFQKKYPSVELVLEEGSNEKLTEMVLSGKVDLALANPINNADLDSIPLILDRVLLAVYHEHPLAQQTQDKHNLPIIDMEKVKDDPFIIISSEHHVRKIADKIFSDHNITPKVILETSSIELAHRLVAQGMALTMVLESMVNYHQPAASYFRFENEYTHSLNICYRKNDYLSKIMLNFIDIAKKVTTQLDNYKPDPFQY